MKQDVKDLVGESAHLVTGFFRRGACTVRVMGDKWRSFARDISKAVDTLVEPLGPNAPEFPLPALDPEGQPVVTVTESPGGQLPIGRQMPLYEANKAVSALDREFQEKELTSQAVKVRIDYMKDGQTDRYYLPLTIGLGGSMLEQMQAHVDAYRADPGKVEKLFDGVSPELRERLKTEFAPPLREGLDTISGKLMRYFQQHCDIASMEQQFDAQAAVMPEREQAAFRAEAQKTVAALRRDMNGGTAPAPGREAAPQEQAASQMQTPQTIQLKARPESAESPRQSVKLKLSRIKQGQTKSGKPPKAKVRLTPQR